MANPITWRNVSAPDFTGASRMLDRAGESFTSAFDALQNTKDTFEEGRTDRNTQAFMDELAQYRSPEELAAAQEAGTIQALRQQYGANGLIDRERTGADAITDRIGKLQQVKQQNQQYQDFNTRLGNRDALRTFNERIAARDLEGAQEIVENTDWVDPTKTAGILRDARATEFDRRNTNRQWVLDVNADRRAQEMHETNLRKLQAELAEAGETEALNNAVTSTYNEFTGELKDGETITMRRNAFLEALQGERFSDMKPGTRSKLAKQLEQFLTGRRALAEGDMETVNKITADAERRMNNNVFGRHMQREEDNGQITKRLLEPYTVKNGDTGVPMVMGIGDANDRLQVQQSVQAALDGVAPDGTVIWEGGIPESYVNTAPEGMKGGGWTNWDKAFGEQLQKVVNSGAFAQDYENYQTAKSEYQTLKQGAIEAARNGKPGTTGSGPSGQQNTNVTITQRPDESDAAFQERMHQFGMQGRTAPAQPQTIKPSKPESGVPAPLKPEAPESKDPGLPQPSPKDKGYETEKDWDTGWDKITGRFGNAFNWLQNHGKGYVRQQYQDQLNSESPDKAKLVQLTRTNPSVVREMTKGERNKLRELIGPDIVDAIMSRKE